MRIVIFGPYDFGSLYCFNSNLERWEEDNTTDTVALIIKSIQVIPVQGEHVVRYACIISYEFTAKEATNN